MAIDPKSPKLRPHGLYLYQSDWDAINLFFRPAKGRIARTKTAAIRDVIHNWVETKILPELEKRTALEQNVPDMPALPAELVQELQDL